MLVRQESCVYCVVCSDISYSNNALKVHLSLHVMVSLCAVPTRH